MARLRNLSTAFSSWLQASVGMHIPCPGDIYFLTKDASSTSQYKTWLQTNGVDTGRIFTDIASAYSALVANRNDVLCVLPGSHTISTAFTWGKDYTHMLGIGAPIKTNQRARFATSGNAISPMITFSADGSIMKNVMCSQDGSHASTAAIGMYLTGDRNYLENVTFRNIGALNVAGNACRTLKIDSANGESTFKDCTIGADTVDGGTATNYVIEFAATQLGNQRITFENCDILGNGSANASFIKADDANCINGSWVKFKECLFSNPKFGDFDEMTQGFSLSATCNGLIYMYDSLVDGCATYESTNSGVLIGRNAYAAATTDSGVALTF